eukprot:Phypoly_transcript_03714.p1 GENE.Phypoly_transcript_03714~~Phypoly_transcript_03714.p1  ORF type:complete len:765 (+),score=114.78 Phypoly_transcript_03714:31-2325(+)
MNTLRRSARALRHKSKATPNETKNGTLYQMEKPASSLPDLEATISRFGKDLHIHQMEDWYYVSAPHLKILPGGASLIRKYGTVEHLLKEAYPAHPWEHVKFANTRLSPQKYLFRIIQTIFGQYGVKIDMNVRSGHGMKANSGLPLEIDIYLPALKLGFEYQDAYHFFHSSYGATTLEAYQARDKLKAQLASERGITLIYVPFWWDWNVQSLIATIKSKRSDLLPQVVPESDPISQEPPPEVAAKFDLEVPGLGLPMLALYAPISQSFNPVDWWLAEKYDGIRGIWNPKERVLFSRWGSRLTFPNYVLDSLAIFWLDGEIWFGKEKGMRHVAAKVSTKTDISTLPWGKFKFIVFDTPHPEFRDLAYRERYSILHAKMGHLPFVQLIKYELCEGKQHAESIFFKLRSEGSEGVILRDPNAPYINGYSHSLYKYKGFIDAEAIVLKKLSDTTYLCQINLQQIDPDNGPNDRFEEVDLRVDDANFEGNSEEIEIGNFVSFRYILQNRKLINPKIYTIRHDITDWNQVHAQRKPSEQKIWKPPAPKNQPINPAEFRKHFDEFAKKLGFEPLVAENWYPLIRTDYFNYHNIKEIITRTGGSHIGTLMQLYPEIPFNIQKFKWVPRNYWASAENRKKFFDDLATSMKFDPLHVSNWYSLKYSDIEKIKGGFDVLTYHKSYASALVDLYPSLPWDKSKLHFPSDKHWTSKENQKQFFDNIALEMKFDPGIPSNWRQVPIWKIRDKQGGASILRRYDNSLRKAISHLYSPTST